MLIMNIKCNYNESEKERYMYLREESRRTYYRSVFSRKYMLVPVCMVYMVCILSMDSDNMPLPSFHELSRNFGLKDVYEYTRR